MGHSHGYHQMKRHDAPLRHHKQTKNSNTQADVNTKYVITSTISGDTKTLGLCNWQTIIALFVILAVVAGAVIVALYETGHLTLPSSSSSDEGVSPNQTSSSSTGLASSSSSSSSSSRVSSSSSSTISPSSSSSSSSSAFTCPVDPSICASGGSGQNPLQYDQTGGVLARGVLQSDIDACLNGLTAPITGRPLDDRNNPLFILNAYVLPNSIAAPCNTLCCNTPGCIGSVVTSQPTVYPEGTTLYGLTNLQNAVYSCILHGHNANGLWTIFDDFNRTTFTSHIPPASVGSIINGYTCEQGGLPAQKNVAPDEMYMVSSFSISVTGDSFGTNAGLRQCIGSCASTPSCLTASVAQDSKTGSTLCNLYTDSDMTMSIASGYTAQMLPNIVGATTCTSGG